VFSIDWYNSKPTKVMLTLLDTNENVTVPVEVIGFDVKPGDLLNLEIE
jgi:hypothetical protein